ncbi:PLP-dependent aminotransferase family protein [Paucibacter sp. R3-3]|uniref:PLP-dependent aminotransferase family protein n=1 Tax=Roseateles agri TaxID=3098619 RepID=A0ABU5DN72_9BURK|nr:PLP-dependent aminotransferase family protein [Paucibacter sp. R3-3]MDY0747761.1 PLP-dependent aminotransferase family protein [Paucibacter sp. R3-3]
MPVNVPSHLLPLNAEATDPFYRQIYDRFRNAIANGTLKPGDRIPSARALMKELGLARGTVETAYSLLAAEGYIQARGQAGTIVTPDLKPAAALEMPALPAKEREGTPSFRPDTNLPFQMGLPALDAFPRKIWARLGARCIRSMQPADMAHPSVYGLPALRAEISSYLQISRGVACSPHQVFITSGYRHTLGLVAHALLMEGSRVWHESPGYPPTREMLTRMGIECVPVPVDRDGIDVAEGLRLAGRASAAVVTPAHQSPTGVSLSLPRRLALLDWASRQKSWIIEDDYDGEYRYVSRPLPALKSLDRDGRVLYAGTFSKVLFPGIRLAYLVVPEALVDHFNEVSHTFTGGSPQLTQAILTAFIAEGHFARHIQRMRKLYAQRREDAVAELQAVLGKHILIDQQPGGMHLILRLKGRRSDRKLVARMREAGLYGEALSEWSPQASGGSAVLVGFTNIESRAVAERLARRLLEVI